MFCLYDMNTEDRSEGLQKRILNKVCTGTGMVVALVSGKTEFSYCLCVRILNCSSG